MGDDEDCRQEKDREAEEEIAFILEHSRKNPRTTPGKTECTEKVESRDSFHQENEQKKSGTNLMNKDEQKRQHKR